jgi:O-antigen ligase
MKKSMGPIFDWLQLAVLMAAAPLFIFPKPRFWWIFLIIPLLWAARKIIKGRFIQPTMVDVPVFIFLAAVFVSTLRVIDFSHSLPKIAGVLFAVAFFYAAAALLKSEKLLKWAVGLFMLGGFCFSLIGLLGMPTFKEKHLHLLMNIKEKIPRIDFGLPGAEMGFAPTVVGGILLLVIPLCFVMGVYAWIHRKEGAGAKMALLSMVIVLAVTGAVLLLTQARGAWAGLFVGTVIIGLLLLLSQAKKKKILAVSVAAFLVIAIIAGIGIYSATNAGQLKPGLKQAEGTLLFRVQLWHLTLPVIHAQPLWGLGLNNFRLLPEVRYFLSHPHNQVLDVTAELGVLAAVAYLAMLLIMGYMCLEAAKKSRSMWLRYAVLGLGWGQMCHLLFCITDAIPPGARVGILWWCSFALITASYNNFLSREEHDGHEEKDART